MVPGVPYTTDGAVHRVEIPAPDHLHEPDDMVIVEPPCHPNEPLKVSDAAAQRLHCLVCGERFDC